MNSTLVQGIGSGAQPEQVTKQGRLTATQTVGTPLSWDPEGTDVIQGVDLKVPATADLHLFAGILKEVGEIGGTSTIVVNGFCEAWVNGSVSEGAELTPVDGQSYLQAGTFTKHPGKIHAVDANTSGTALKTVRITGF